MGRWIVIVDLETHVDTINDGEYPAVFDTLEEIEELHKRHTLRVFSWTAVEIETGEITEV